MSSPSLRLVALGLFVIVSAAGCTSDPQRGPTTTPSTDGATASATAGATVTTRPADPNVIDFSGLRDIRIGASMAELVRTGVVTTADPVCGVASFASIPNASPVFERDRLVLIWAHAPLRTPEGVMVGTKLAEARRAYPSAIELPVPAGSEQFPGLIVTGAGDRAYLILHDGNQVQKLIVGIEHYARLLFDTGYGTC